MSARIHTSEASYRPPVSQWQAERARGPLQPLQVVRKATVSDWLSGFFCVAGIIAIVTAWGIAA